MSGFIINALLVLLVGGATGILYVLRDSFKKMGAVEEREKQTFRKVEGGKKANEAEDDVAKLDDAAVIDQLREWGEK